MIGPKGILYHCPECITGLRLMSPETDRIGHGVVVACPGLGRQDSGERGDPGTTGVKVEVVLSIIFFATEEAGTGGSKELRVR